MSDPSAECLLVRVGTAGSWYARDCVLGRGWSSLVLGLFLFLFLFFNSMPQ